MAEDKDYFLVFLIDGSQISKKDLDAKVKKIIGKHLNAISLTIEPLETNRLQLTIKGSLQTVDACHKRMMNQGFFEKHHCPLLKDDAGDEIRKKMYPRLASIEQSLRGFINKVMIEILGFDWWDRMAPSSVQEKVSRRGKNDQIHHPLELSTFDELIEILFNPLQQWTEGKPLTPADLKELLNESRSIDELRKKLEEKTKKIPLWNDVFSRYFDDPSNKKEDLQKDLKEVLDLRNRVMHHRSVWEHELTKLREIEGRVKCLINSAKSKLPEKELKQARRSGEAWVQQYRKLLEAYQQEMAGIVKILSENAAFQAARAAVENPAFRQQMELSREIARQYQPFRDIILKTLLGQLKPNPPPQP